MDNAKLVEICMFIINIISDPELPPAVKLVKIYKHVEDMLMILGYIKKD